MADEKNGRRADLLSDAIDKSYAVLEIDPGFEHHPELFQAILDAADAIREAKHAWGDEWTL